MASVSSSVKWVDNVPSQRVVNDSVYKTPSNSASHIKDLHKQELLPCLLLLKLRATEVLIFTREVGRCGASRDT